MPLPPKDRKSHGTSQIFKSAFAFVARLVYYSLAPLVKRIHKGKKNRQKI
jgi:hypothetical protein